MRKLLLATTALVPFGLAPAIANPLGGQVAAGGATIGGTGTAQVTINQSTQNAVINWKSFNIGAGESTQFVQPNASASVLNRVTGDPNASQINGMLTANGRVFVINPNGILIGRGAVINTGSFLASTHDITNENFMAGRYNFNIPGRPDASIVNLGTITASNSGFAALVAPGVRNSGTITANFGKIGLASANGFSLDFYGDRLIQLDVNDQIAGNVRDVATGETLRALVQNDGKLKANGGRVELTAVAARQVVDSVINTSGVIEAHSIGRHGGKIVLGAATGSSKPVGAPTQTVKVSGKLSVASKKSKGGKVQITGENIELADARIDASGATGGGTVLIGGGPQGAGDSGPRNFGHDRDGRCHQCRCDGLGQWRSSGPVVGRLYQRERFHFRARRSARWKWGLSRNLRQEYRLRRNSCRHIGAHGPDRKLADRPHQRSHNRCPQRVDDIEQSRDDRRLGVYRWQRKYQRTRHDRPWAGRYYR